MGIFSKKRKVTVGITAARLIEKVESPYKQAVLTSVFSKRNITDVLLNNSNNGLLSKVNRLYNYGRGSYIHGLPEGYKNYSNINNTSIGVVLSRIFSQSINVIFSKVSYADPIYFGYRYLQETFRYDPASKVIGNPPIVYPINTIVKAVNVSLNPDSRVITVDAEIQKPNLLPTDPLPPKEFITWTLNFSVETEKTYLQVMYQLPKDIAENSTRYWYYDVMTNTYPEINTILDESIGSPFYPIIPLRQNKINVLDVVGQENKDVKRALRIINLDLKVLTEAIMSTEDGNDPNLVDEAFLGFFAYLGTETQYTKLYLWEFFNELYESKQVTKNIFDTWYSNKSNRDTPQEAMIIKERDFNIRLLWNYIDKTVINEVIGPVGTATISTTVENRFTLQDFDFEESSIYLKKQISTTEVEMIRVNGLEHLTDVYEGSLHNTTIADLSNSDKKDGWYIPISKTVLNKLRPSDRHMVLSEGLSVIVYAVQISYVKWYQRGLFKVLVLIVAIVIAIYTGDWALVYEAGLTWQTAATVITNLIINFATIKGLEFVAGMIGGEIAAIIAAVVAVYALTKGDATVFNTGMKATELLNTSMLAIEASNNVIKEDILNIMDDIQDLVKSVQEKKEEIKEAYALLGSEDIDFFDLRKGGFYFNPNELPDDFFNRTVHNKNPGTSGYDYISYFVDNALKLQPSSKWEM